MRPKLFLDMDDTFYNWRAMFEGVREALRGRGCTDARIDAAVAKANAKGFSFDRLLEYLHFDMRPAHCLARELDYHLSISGRHVFDHTLSVLWRIAKLMDIELLTFGYKPYQQAKWAALERLHTDFTATHFVYNDRTKGEVIAAESSSDGLVFFCDDNPDQLLDVRAKAPWCQCVRMRHRQIPSEDHPGDGVEWAVVHDMHELLAWLYSQMSKIRVLFAHSEHYDEVRQFLNERGEELLQSGALPEMDADARSRLFDQGRIIVARTSNGQIVGTAMMYYGQTWRQQIGHVEYVLVDHDHRKLGIGHMMLVALHADARERGAKVIKLTVESHRADARRLYHFLGYERDQYSDAHLRLTVG